MKKILGKILLFIIPIVCLLGFLEYSAYQIPNIYQAKAEAFKKNKDQIEWLFLGASRTAQNINTDLMSKRAFNNGLDLELIYSQTAIANRYEDQMPNLEMVIFNVTPPIVEMSAENTDADMIKYKIKHYYGIPPEFKRSYFNIQNYSLVLTMGYDRFLQDFLNRFQSGNQIEDPIQISQTGFQASGGYGHLEAKNDTEIAQNMASAYSVYYGNHQTYENNLEYLRQTAENLKSKGIKVVFLMTPTSKAYQETYEEEYQTLNKSLNTMTDNNMIFYLDFFKDNQLDYIDFQDASHLTEEGGGQIYQAFDKSTRK